MARAVDVWLRPGVQLLDVTGPIEVFSSATRLLAARRGASKGKAVSTGIRGGYDVRLVSEDGRSVTTAAGVRLVADVTPRGLRAKDRRATLVVPGKLDDPDTGCDPATTRVLGRWSGRVASVCAGAWLLAEAGLLDGRRATTHWLVGERLARRFPRVEVDADAIHVRDGRIWTSAGVSAGIDLALAIVEADHGRELALELARLLVLYLQRPGGQSQFSAALEAQSTRPGTLADLCSWMAAHPDADLRVEALAARAGQSPRHFARTFLAEIGTTPAKRVRALRIDAARRLLEERPDLSLEGVARASGLGTAESLRRAFAVAVGVTPGAYRRRFGGGSTGG